VSYAPRVYDVQLRKTKKKKCDHTVIDWMTIESGIVVHNYNEIAL